MLGQKSAIVQTNLPKKEFENVEEIIMRVYDKLDEYDEFIRTAEIEIKKKWR